MLFDIEGNTSKNDLAVMKKIPYSANLDSEVKSGLIPLCICLYMP